MSTPDYYRITSVLERLDIPVDGAESHGAASAIVCLMGRDGLDSWIKSHLPEIEESLAEGNALAREAKEVLNDLYESVYQELHGGDFAFELLMPDEDDSLETRTHALSAWCQGFLLGLRFGGVTDISKFSGELSEILQDITEISQVSGNGLENNEEEEQSYTELVEYLRVGVMLFFETLQKQNRLGQTTTVH